MTEQQPSTEKTPRQSRVARMCGSTAPHVYQSSELFNGAREIWIEHDSEIYRLRLTRNHKLILHK